MTKVAHIQLVSPLVIVIRVVEGGVAGDPYDLKLVGRVENTHTCELMGLDRPMRPSDWRAIRAALQSFGIQHVVFDRHKPDGTVRRVTKGLHIQDTDES